MPFSLHANNTSLALRQAGPISIYFWFIYFQALNPVRARKVRRLPLSTTKDCPQYQDWCWPFAIDGANRKKRSASPAKSLHYNRNTGCFGRVLPPDKTNPFPCKLASDINTLSLEKMYRYMSSGQLRSLLSIIVMMADYILWLSIMVMIVDYTLVANHSHDCRLYSGCQS